MRRTCPKCECLSPPDANNCVACGYKLVLEPERKARPAVIPQPRKIGVKLALQHCVYCGAPTKGTVCRGHSDLA